jgi:hypothetical protein
MQPTLRSRRGLVTIVVAHGHVHWISLDRRRGGVAPSWAWRVFCRTSVRGSPQSRATGSAGPSWKQRRRPGGSFAPEEACVGVPWPNQTEPVVEPMGGRCSRGDRRTGLTRPPDQFRPRSSAPINCGRWRAPVATYCLSVPGMGTAHGVWGMIGASVNNWAGWPVSLGLLSANPRFAGRQRAVI